MSRSTFFVILLALMCCGIASASPQPRASFEYLAAPEKVLIDYSVEYRKVTEADREKRIRVFGDGRVELHRPFWHVQGGSFSIQLTDDEIQTLLDQLLTHGALHFDAASTQQKRLAEDRRFKNLGLESDTSADSWVYLFVHIDGFQQPHSTVAEGPVDQQIAWRNLEWTAEHYRQIPAIEGLRTATRALDALWHHEALVEDSYKRGEAP